MEGGSVVRLSGGLESVVVCKIGMMLMEKRYLEEIHRTFICLFHRAR